MDLYSRSIRGVERARSEYWGGHWSCSHCGRSFPAEASWWVVLGRDRTLRFIVCPDCVPGFRNVGPMVVDRVRLRDLAQTDPLFQRVREHVNWVIRMRGTVSRYLAIRGSDIRGLAAESESSPDDLAWALISSEVGDPWS